MPIYTGSTEDGSDIEEFEGFFANPDNSGEWSSTPYPSQVKFVNQRKAVMEYMNGRYCLNDVRDQIINKICPLSASLRKYVMDHYDSEGNFLFEH